ncbi:MAG: alkaline phosphatase D family protein [Akkermansiaceae bacterium]|nr:alkaline phosphatase D family protein [Akkermansiaceae bacterium]
MKKVLPLILLAPLAQTAMAAEVSISWPEAVVRPWPGPELWANPAEDWLVKSGRAGNTFPGGNRNLTVPTPELTPASAPFTIRCRFDQTSPVSPVPGFAGIQVGLAAASGDYREAAIYGAGLCAGIKADGTLFIGDTAGEGEKVPVPFRAVTLELQGLPAKENRYRLSLTATDSSGQLLGTTRAEVHGSWVQGLVAFTASTKFPAKADYSAPRPKAGGPAIPQARGGSLRIAFDRLVLAGGKVALHPERAFGPIYWVTQAPSNDGSIRLLVQAAPFASDERHDVSLILDGRAGGRVALDLKSRTARFVLRRKDLKVPHSYEVKLAGGSFKGTIRPIPDGRALMVAALSCDDATGFPHNDLVANVAAHKPDLFAFLGDQIYEGVGGYGNLVDQRSNDRTLVCYLRKYAMHGWIWRDALRDTPSVTLPDDHDVFHGNLWGTGGKQADVSKGYGFSAQDSGGYKMSPEFVNAVHATQTGNLPDPIDPSPCDNAISVYFTRWQYGCLDMAIIADRQFKSAPRDLLTDGKIENGWPQNSSYYLAPPPDHPGAELLGPRQEAFLKRWAARPDSASPMRMVMSQSPWAAPQTLPAEVQSDSDVPGMKNYKPGEYAPNDQPKPDFDTNGWPQGKRKLALELMKQAGALHVTGDQHLGSTGQYGLATHRDGPWWVSTPATANTWPRRWMPAAKGGNARPGDPRETGDFVDAFGNKITIAAVANPLDIDREPARLFDRAVGYTILRCDPAAGQVTITNWPYWASPAKPAPDNQPYPGWPLTINPKTGERL